MSYVQTRCGEYLNFLLSVEFGPEGKHVNSTESLGMEKGKMHVFFIDIWKMCFLKLCQKLFPFTHSAHTYMDIEMIRDECYDICVQNLLTHRCNSFVPCHLIVHSTSVSLQQVPRCLCVRASVCVCIFKGKSIRFQVFDLFLQLRKKYCLIWSFFL